MKRKRMILSVLTIIAAAGAVIGGILIMDRFRQNKQNAQLDVVSVESIPEAELPSEERDEDWFVGDWAGLITGEGEPDRKWTDFGMATLDYYQEETCLLRVHTTGRGYEAKLGSSVWAVTEHDMQSVTLCCTTASFETEPYRDSVYCENALFEEGQTMTLVYSQSAESSAPGAEVPEENILIGEVSPKDGDEWNRHLILSLLPPGESRDGESGKYPCWFGGYENMDGDFHGMFCLGVSARGKRMLGEVLERGDGAETVIGVFDGAEYDRRTFYGARDMRASDLTMNFGTQDADGALFPLFERYDADGTPSRWTDVSAEHTLYYETVYIPRMQAEIDSLEAGAADDIWTKRQIAVRRGFIEYAKKIVNGEYSGAAEKLIPCIPQLVLLDGAYRDEASLAGIKPGDTIEDAKKLYSLHPLEEDEEAMFGLEGLIRGKTLYYTDGRGMLIYAYAENGRELIGRVELVKPGYETPDGRQVGDMLDRTRQVVYVRDARISFGGWYLETGDAIDMICMTVALDRVWDETELDVDGDGEPERLTLSGRCFDSYAEQGTVFGNAEIGTVEDIDFGTKATLCIYKNGALYKKTQLPLYIYYLLPRFCEKEQTETPGEIYIVCETGGTGNEEPVYCVKTDGEAFQTKFVGFRDIYSS